MLFGGHVGERASDRLGRLGRLPLAGQARYTEPGEPHASIGGPDNNVGWLDVLVDQASLVDFAQSRGNADREG